MKRITFGADNIKISGPRVDGTFALTFETGEYMRKEVLQIMELDPPVWVTVSTNEEEKSVVQ